MTFSPQLGSMRGSWSFWEDAIDSVDDGEVGRGLAAVEPVVASIDQWLFATFTANEQRSSLWLALFTGSSMCALVGTVYGTPTMLYAALTAVVGTGAAYAYEKTFYRRLVKRIQNGKPAPQIFTDANGEAARNYISSLFATPRIVFGNDGKPTRFSHKLTVLDLVWLTDVDEALPLKRALCGRSQFPVAISRPVREVIVPSPPPQADPQQQPPPPPVTYNVTSKIVIDQRQVHFHSNEAGASQQSNGADNPDKAPGDNIEPSADPHWLGPITDSEFSKLFAEFEKHLPDGLKWMALIVWYAKPIVDRHPDWTDLHILKETLLQVQIDEEWKRLQKPPMPTTVEKLLYRDRSNSYTWVREFFANTGRRHKYNETGQISLEL